MFVEANVCEERDVGGRGGFMFDQVGPVNEVGLTGEVGLPVRVQLEQEEILEHFPTENKKELLGNNQDPL